MNEQETHADIIAEMRSGLLSATVECENCGDKQEQRFTFNGLANRLEAAYKRERGDRAKLREAVLALKELDFNKEEDCYDFYRIIDAALAAPPRNCDVGTAEEQEKRYNEWLNADVGRAVLGLDPLEWAQMPYEEGGAR